MTAVKTFEKDKFHSLSNIFIWLNLYFWVE